MISKQSPDRSNTRYEGTLDIGELGYLKELGINIGEDNHLNEYQDATVRFNYTVNKQTEERSEELIIEDRERATPKTVYETDFEGTNFEREDIEAKLEEWNSFHEI